MFGDGSYILYVNSRYKRDDKIGRLMYHFLCISPYDMNYEILAKKTRYFKQDKERAAVMCKMMEDMRNEVELDKAKRTAIHLIKLGKMTLEEIAEATELSLDEIANAHS